MDTTEYTAIIRSMIQHEDTLRDQRLGWLFALNSFLFTGLGFAWADDDSGPLIVVLSLVGVLVAASSAVALATSAPLPSSPTSAPRWRRTKGLNYRPLSLFAARSCAATMVRRGG